MSHTPLYFLTTKRLGFRHWQSADAPLAWQLWGDPAVTQLITQSAQLSEADVHARLVQELETQTQHGIQYWPLFVRATDSFVGCCGLRPYPPDAAVLELGFHICSAHWRKGYALEAAQAVIRYAFDHTAVDALFAGHHPNNTASRRLLQKLGFAYTRDEWYAPTRLHHPSYRLSRSSALP